MTQHVDGITNAQQIAIKAEVDMEMVLSCLRVLLHHGVIALVDMFFFSNRYECTEAASSLLRQGSSLLEAAALFVSHTSHEQQSPFTLSVASSGHPEHSTDKACSSPSSREHHVDERMASFHAEQDAGRRSDRVDDVTNGSLGSRTHHEPDRRRTAHFGEVKSALRELYLMCQRGASIGDIWIKVLTSDPPRTRSAIDWKYMFQTIDNRRFTSFGIVHGLIRRVHVFPLLLDTNITDSQRHRLLNREADAKDGLLGQNRRRQWPQADEEQSLRLRVAKMMDGQHCDDELVCTFDKPLSELSGMMEDQTVVYVLAPSCRQ